MKTFLSLLALAAVAAIGAGSALAHTTTPTAAKTVTVVMHDPGCHWFSVNGKFLTKLSTSGPVALANFDEAALKVHVVGAPDRLDRTGQKLVLGRGVYAITMVGQAKDDNHLKLTVK